MKKVRVSEATGIVLDYLVVKSKGWLDGPGELEDISDWFRLLGIDYSTDWAQAGPIIERESISIIRANDDYGIDDKGFTTHKPIPRWFAECSQWTGHSLTASYEGENMDPTFMIGEDGGYYGPTPLIAAMRCFVASKLGDEVEVPDELLG